MFSFLALVDRLLTVYHGCIRPFFVLLFLYGENSGSTKIIQLIRLQKKGVRVIFFL